MKMLSPSLKNIFLFIFIFCNAILFAQNDYARVVGGVNLATPFLNNGYKAKDWKGINVRSHAVELGFTTGNVWHNDVAERGTLWYVGMNYAFQNLKFGNRQYGVKGFLVIPFVAGSVGGFDIGKTKAFQAIVAPGISLQLPYTTLDFRMNTIFSTKSGDGISTVRFMPGIAIQMDALWDVFDPKLQFDGTRYSHFYSYEYNTTTEHHDDYDIVTTTTTTKYNTLSSDIYQYNVGPYIAIGPRVTYTQHAWTGKTEMLGLSFSGRARGLSYDIISETGKVGFASSYLKASTYDDPAINSKIGAPAEDAKFNKNDSRFVGNSNCARALIRLGFDGNRSERHANQFTRFMFGMGVGYALFSNPHFENDSAAKMLDNYFAANPNVIRSDRMDPRQFQNGVFYQLFFSFEMGAISIGYEKNIYTRAALADAGTLTFTYNIPYEKIYDTKQKMKFMKRNNIQ